MELGLAGKTALVTGGSKGIGLETARALAREGVKVLICARRETALAEAARDIMQTTQAKIETQPLDVTKVNQIETMPRIVREKLGRIDILVNNAGTGTYKPFLEVTDDGARRRHGDQFLRAIPYLSADRADDDGARRRPHRQCQRPDRDHDAQSAISVIMHRTGEIGRDPVLKSARQ